MHISNSSSTRKTLQIHLYSSRNRSENGKNVNLTALPQRKEKEPQVQPEKLQVSTGEKLENGKPFFISDITEWKLRMSLWPNRPL